MGVPPRAGVNLKTSTTPSPYQINTATRAPPPAHHRTYTTRRTPPPAHQPRRTAIRYVVGFVLHVTWWGLCYTCTVRRASITRGTLTRLTRRTGRTRPGAPLYVHPPRCTATVTQQTCQVCQSCGVSSSLSTVIVPSPARTLALSSSLNII